MAEDFTVLVSKPDDEIVISLVEQKMVVHETVRINVTVAAQRDENTNEDDLRKSVKAALRKFINTEWRFISVGRQRGRSRFEDVVVQAIARVPESENVQLAERADAVSTPTVQLIQPAATYALPFDKVQEINQGLRAALVEQAAKELALYNKVGRGTYRIGEIVFADTPRASGGAQNMRAGRAYSNNATVSAASGQYSATGGGEPDTEEGAPDLGVTERFWVAAQVTFRSAP